MYCPQCGTTNENSARFCSACGLNLEEYARQWQEPGGLTAEAESTAQQQAYSQQYTPAPPPYQQQYEQQYQQSQYYQPRSPYGAIPHIPSYMGWAIATLILCFWPTGIVAVVYAGQVGNKLAIGDVMGAQESSRKAKIWCWVTFGIALAGYAIALIVVLIGAFAFSSMMW